MDGLTVLTFEGTSNSATYDMTVDIPEGKTLVLKTARVEITYVGDAYPRSINIGIGNTPSTTYVIDNDAGYNYFKVMMDQKLYTTAAPEKINVSVTYPDAGYKVSGRLYKNCTVNLYDSSHLPLPNLVYYFFQFIVL